ncbi:Outer membrane protein assembly factor YaeT precursor [hydrothermal vent metagenome]|uniref:Outer membrane protein assembly factor YaeT n=1 Tax=hydrothermal vent metagenome TaxID=652676 RepID=A0A1W1CU55_9ZZZZ
MIKKTLFSKILLSWMLIGSLLLAQKVTQIKFEGLIHLSDTTAKEVAGINIGDTITAENINESIKNFFAQGYFKDVWVDQRGGTLIYHFKEKLAIANVEIKGYGSGDDGEKLLAGIGLKKGDLYDARHVRKAKRTLVSRLESQGYYDTVVEVTTSPVGESSVSIVFDVNKGEKITIKKINFIGSKEVSQDDLELELANKEKDVLGWMPWRNDGKAAVEQLEYDAYRVKNTYMKHGYIDAKVSKPLMRVDFGSYNAEVDYQIVEGKQYRVGKVSIVQHIDGLDVKSLEHSLLLQKGKIFNIKRMRADIKMLKEEIGNFGYAYVQVLPQMNKNAEKNVIDLQYVVQPGEPVTINDVIISGNNTTKDRVIRRYIYLAPGDKFNATDLKDSKSALGRTGFFEKVDIQSQRISADKINLLVHVKETSTGAISAGGGYGSYEGLMVNASVSDKNLFGSGISSTIGFEVSKISKNFNLSFTNPKVWDSMYSFSTSLYKKDHEYLDYTEDQLGANISVGREFYRHFHASVGLGYIDNKSTVTNTDANSTVSALNSLLYADKYSKVSFLANISYDNTDDYYVPREGMKAVLSFEYGKLYGDDYNATTFPGGYGDILRTSGKIAFYYGLEDWIDYDLILRVKGKFSMVRSNDNEKLPVAERLFSGGIGSIRGYDPYSLSPYFMDANGNRSLIGGTKRASASFEASIPLSQAAKMRLAFFYDYGTISTDRKDSAGSEITNNITRSSAGVVLEWRSSFGPINLVFAKPLDDEEGDKTAAFEFSMGTKF